ncbi:glycosyltransferase [Kocuria rosea]|uniref:glycosyltransferase n=1 Tax=Kocuria rosea TaxID=1275 RepID=UPI00197D4AD1|nr:glycosyltransferase [Kocuria rosea]
MRVATNLAKALDARGHETELWAGVKGYPRGTRVFDGARVRLFPARLLMPRLGFATSTARGILRAVIAERRSIDMLHIHLARDLVTLPAALLAKALSIPYVVQTHGMITPKSSPWARVFDLALTRPALRGASTVLYLTPHERSQLQQTDGRLTRLERLVNGIDTETGHRPVPAENSKQCEVLFMARLHPRKRPVLFVRSARELLSRGRQARFRVVGPDEGEGPSMLEEIEASGRLGQIIYEGPIPPEQTGERLARCDVYVLPSVDEPYPMSVIEAMAQGKPVVITDSCGIARQVEAAGAGLVVNSDQDTLTDAIDLLLRDGESRRRMGRRARALVEQDFDIGAVSERLCRIYSEARGAEKGVEL